MWNTRKRSSTTVRDKQDIPAIEMSYFDSNLSSLQRKYSSGIQTDKIVLTCGPKTSKLSKIRHWSPLITKGALVPVLPLSRMGPRADCPFHPRSYKRPDFTTKRAFAREWLCNQIDVTGKSGNEYCQFKTFNCLANHPKLFYTIKTFLISSFESIIS